MIDSMLGHVERLCRERGLRLTEKRRRVLEILLQSDRPMGAYDLMHVLDNEAGGQRRTAPPTVYRALEFLQSQGFIHRIASVQAYVPCIEPDHTHAGQFLICTDCGRVDELDDRRLDRSVGAAAAAHGFSRKHHVEVTGRCDECTSSEGARR
jgi:Fur family zinc uptake transcriptional regulator